MEKKKMGGKKDERNGRDTERNIKRKR